MDLRTLFLAQTGALVATAAMLWLARGEADRHNGLRTWTFAITGQGLAYLLLAQAGRLPFHLGHMLGNAVGAFSVALFFVAIRQFLGLRYSRSGLAAMVLAVTVVAAAAGADYSDSTIFNGFAFGLIELLNARVLWRAPAAESAAVQRVVALFYCCMGLVLPLRAAGLLLAGAKLDELKLPPTWQEPIYVFGFLFIIVTNLGFLQLCKIRAEADARREAMTDGLTGLPNRRALDDALALALLGQPPFALLMVDLDHFKAINDQFGHRAGDAALIAFAQRLSAGLRAQDQAFRYGGEEFCVLLPDTHTAGAAALAERLRRHVALPAKGFMPAISASFGLAVWQSGDNADALFGRADGAMYRAKKLGRDRVEVA